MKKTLLILIILSLPLISKGSDNLVAVLYLKNGSYVSSDSVYTFLNLDGTMFDELRSRNGNEPTCLKIDRDNSVSYYLDLMIYVFFCKLSPTRKVLVRLVMIGNIKTIVLLQSYLRRGIFYPRYSVKSW